MKINIVGLGRVYEHYKNIIHNLNGIEINIGYDMDAQKREVASKSIKVSDSLDEFIKEPADLICILTPSGTHYELAKTMLQNKRNILIEKPMTLIANECEILKKLARENNSRIYCGFQNRFNKAVIRAKDCINKGVIGKIISCHVALEWCRHQEYYSDEWHGQWKLDGGVIAQQAIHHIDAASYLLGRVKKVIGTMRNVENILEAEDTFTGMMEFENGLTSTLSASTSFRPQDKEARISINGTSGTINIYGIAINKLDITTNEFRETIDEYFETGYGLSHGPMLTAIMKDLNNGDEVNSMLKDRLNIDQAIHTTEIISALYYSSEHSRWGMCGKDISERWGVK